MEVLNTIYKTVSSFFPSFCGDDQEAKSETEGGSSMMEALQQGYEATSAGFFTTYQSLIAGGAKKSDPEVRKNLGLGILHQITSEVLKDSQKTVP